MRSAARKKMCMVRGVSSRCRVFHRVPVIAGGAGTEPGQRGGRKGLREELVAERIELVQMKLAGFGERGSREQAIAGPRRSLTSPALRAGVTP